MKVFVTGAKGYIGAHIVRTLAGNGCTVISTDCGEGNDISAYVDDYIDWDITQAPSNQIRDYMANVDAVIHTAALISVEESVRRPTDYYQTNLWGTINILCTLSDCKFIFASTGTAPTLMSPYAISKFAAEEVIREQAKKYTIFRFYNVAGSCGFHNFNEPTHLMRQAALVARGERESFSIFGVDYETRDGTCIRDYIHVEDVADAVYRAVMEPAAMTDYECLGSGKEYTVREVLETMKKVSGVDFKIIECPRRAGDPPILTVPKISSFMQPCRNLEQMCRETLDYL